MSQKDSRQAGTGFEVTYMGPARMSMPKLMGRRPVAMTESQVALDLVRSMVLTNSSRICSLVRFMVDGKSRTISSTTTVLCVIGSAGGSDSAEA